MTTRRKFAMGVVGLSVLGSGCLGYTTTSKDDYELIQSGYTNGNAWIDIQYNGDDEGRVQYQIYIEAPNGVTVKESSVQGEMLHPGDEIRLSAEMDDILFDRDEASVGFIIVNSELENMEDQDVGSVPIN